MVQIQCSKSKPQKKNNNLSKWYLSCSIGGIIVVFCTLFLIRKPCVGYNVKYFDEKSHVDVTLRNDPKFSFTTGLFDETIKGQRYACADSFCYSWGNSTFVIKNTTQDECKKYEIIGKKEDKLFVQFNISNLHLYGGSEQSYQHWPTDYHTYINYPFVSSKNDAQAALEPYWLFSDGHYIYVDQTVPLFISLDKQYDYFLLTAQNKPPYNKTGDTILRYTICSFSDAKKAHRNAVKTFLGKPKGKPDVNLVRSPIWSTWAEFKKDVNQENVLNFAKSIKEYQFDASHIEIDDNWEECYGTLTVNKQKFPNMKKLVSDIKELGFKVSIWIHPFINVACGSTFSFALGNGYFVHNHNKSTLTSWWDGRAAGLIDFTNPEAVDWWQKRIQTLQAETGISTFKFDAGESSWSPQLPVFYKQDNLHPENILQAYVKACSYFGNSIEVRSARGTQEYPIFVRMIDRATRWSFHQGLPTLVTELLHLNMIGYPFVLPDMIGGNSYAHDDPLTSELFIRWIQANTFMPALQFSHVPWDTRYNVTSIAKKYAAIHKMYAGTIEKLMDKAVTTGDPINPPIWWIDPTDKTALGIGSEYLLGENVLVAPVLEEGMSSRDIYLPKGTWIDEAKPNKPKIIGPTWLRAYPAKLDVLPYFTRLNSASSSSISIFLIMMLVVLAIFS